MKNRIQNAFEPIRASESLKRKTLAAVTSRRRPVAGAVGRHAVLATLLFLAVVSFGGYRVYYTPTDVISIDMESSVELSINRFERVIGWNGFGTDGEEILESLSLRHKKYDDAVCTVINKTFSQGEDPEDMHVRLTVASNSPQRQRHLMETLAQGDGALGDMSFECHAGFMENVREAHRHEMSLGKYSLYLELTEAGEELTIEEMRKMQMRDVRKRMQDKDPDDSEGTQQRKQHGQ